jgi:hypothetical protein
MSAARANVVAARLPGSKSKIILSLSCPRNAEPLLYGGFSLKIFLMSSFLIPASRIFFINSAASPLSSNPKPDSSFLNNELIPSSLGPSFSNISPKLSSPLKDLYPDLF